MGQCSIVRCGCMWHTKLALKRDGTVWAWGVNWAGQLGNDGGDQSNPVQVLGVTGIVAMRYAAWLLLGLIGGVVADRVDRQRVMVYVDLARTTADRRAAQRAALDQRRPSTTAAGALVVH